MYILTETDRAGNSIQIDQNEFFAPICISSILAKRARPHNEYTIYNDHFVDVDWPDGLTEAERELLP